MYQLLEHTGWDLGKATDEVLLLCMDGTQSTVVTLPPGVMLQPSEASVIAQRARSRGFMTPAIHYAAQTPVPKKTELELIQETAARTGARMIDPSRPSDEMVRLLRDAASGIPFAQQLSEQAGRAQVAITAEEAERRFEAERRSQQERQRQIEEEKRRLEAYVQELERQHQANTAEHLRLREELARQEAVRQEETGRQLERQREALALEAARMAHEERVSIYYNQEASDQERENISVIQGIFQAERIPPASIVIRDYTGDVALSERIHHDSTTATRHHASPMVYIHGHPVGDLEDCRRLIADQQHHLLLNSEKAPPPCDSSGALDIGFGSRLLSMGESTAGVVGSLVMAPVTAFRWLAGYSEPVLEPGVSITVVRTNFLNREQHRTLHFTETKLLRIDPSNNSVREEATYDEITHIISVDANNIIIHYKDETKHYPDYVRARQVDIIRMKVLFNEKSKGQIHIFNPQEHPAAPAAPAAAPPAP